MSELVPISILIADRTYRIRTSPEDEETVRKTVKTINEKILEFKTQFAGKDMQDYIAMVIIWYAAQVQARSADPGLSESLVQELNKIEAMLDKGL